MAGSLGRVGSRYTVPGMPGRFNTTTRDRRRDGTALEILCMLVLAEQVCSFVPGGQ